MTRVRCATWLACAAGAAALVWTGGSTGPGHGSSQPTAPTRAAATGEVLSAPGPVGHAARTVSGTGAPAGTASEGRAHRAVQDMSMPYDARYQFARLRFEARSGRGGFGGFGRGREPMWAHDYPRAERNFLQIIEETTHVRTRPDGMNVFAADDPRLFQHPIAYIVEVGAWDPTDAEVEALAAYLGKGGFLIVDDFRGRFALDNLAHQMDRILPGAQLRMLEPTHEIFDSFFRIVPDEVIPPYGNEPPLWLAVFEDNDVTKRIQVMVNYNNDLAEYWEYSDYGYYPIDLSNEAYKLGVNYVVYAHTH